MICKPIQLSNFPSSISVSIFCPLLVLPQSPLVLDDQVIFFLTVSLDKLPVNTLRAKVRHTCIYTNRVCYHQRDSKMVNYFVHIEESIPLISMVL